jgi:hypothetical protein
MNRQADHAGVSAQKDVRVRRIEPVANGLLEVWRFDEILYVAFLHPAAVGAAKILRLARRQRDIAVVGKFLL